MGSSHVPLVYWWWPAAAKMWSILVAMQDRCPLWSASCSVLIKSLISSATWWFCTQSAGVLPPSASHLQVSSNLSSNTDTTGSVFLAPIFLSATFSMKALISPQLLMIGEGKFHDVLIDNCIDQEVSTDCLVVVGCRTSRIDQLDPR